MVDAISDDVQRLPQFAAALVVLAPIIKIRPFFLVSVIHSDGSGNLRYRHVGYSFYFSDFIITSNLVVERYTDSCWT